MPISAMVSFSWPLSRVTTVANGAETASSSTSIPSMGITQNHWIYWFYSLPILKHYSSFHWPQHCSVKVQIQLTHVHCPGIVCGSFHVHNHSLSPKILITPCAGFCVLLILRDEGEELIGVSHIWWKLMPYIFKHHFVPWFLLSWACRRWLHT